MHEEVKSVLRVCMLGPGWNTYTEQKAKPGGTQAITSNWPPITGIETSVFPYILDSKNDECPNGPKWSLSGKMENVDFR